MPLSPDGLLDAVHAIAAPIASALAPASGLAATGLALALGLAAGTHAAEDVPLIPRSVLFGNPDRAGVQISPDGTKLGYLAPRDGVLNVWIEPLRTREAARPVTSATERPIRSWRWAWNGEQVIYGIDRGGDENTRLVAVDLATGEEIELTPGAGVQASILAAHRDRPDELLVTMNDRDPRFMDVHLVNTRTGARELVFRNNEGWVGMIPDDDWAIRGLVRFTEDGGNLIRLRESADAEWFDFLDVPMEDSLTTQPLGFNRDGTILHMLDSTGGDTAALVAVDVDAQSRTVLYEDRRADVSGAMLHPVTRMPEAVSSTYLRTEWTVLDDAVAGDLAALRELADGDPEVISRSAADDQWIVAYLEDDGPVEYWLWRRDTAEGRRLFTNRADLEGRPLVEMRSVEIPARDGLVLPSYVSVPRDASGPVPMVLLVHGGPWARDDWGFNPYHQWLANRGYAVLSVNFRGSTGFGKDFVNAGNREWGAAMHDDLLDAVAWAVAEGITTPDRVAIMGGSYGGYATLAGLTFTPDAFACGVSIVGPSHVRTLLESIPPYWEPVKVLFEQRVGSLDDPEYLDSISPLMKVDEIRRPLLIGQGANDPRVKIGESDQIVAAMQSHGLPVTYVVFPDEGHGFARPENDMAFNAITEAFLAAHLGGRAEPIGDDVAASTAQLRALGDLDLPGVAPWDPATAPPPAAREDGPVALEDLSEAQQQAARAALAQIEQVPAAQLPQLLEGMRMQESMVPAEERKLFLYLLGELERRLAEKSTGGTGGGG